MEPIHISHTVTTKWTERETAFLVTHYSYMGDVEISELMNKQFPRPYLPWTRKHVAKKRMRLDLLRTSSQLTAIRERNVNQNRYNTEPARLAFKPQRDHVSVDYVLACCMRISKPNRCRLANDHKALIEFTRQEIIRKRADRITYAV